MNRILHIVVAAGSGRRFGAELPKQFHLIGERPVLMLAVDAMRRYGCGGTVVTVLNPDYIGYWTEVCVSVRFRSRADCGRWLHPVGIGEKRC